MTPREPDVEPKEVAIAAARAADEKHGTDIVILQVGKVLAVAEYFVVVGASNRRTVRTLVEEIELLVRQQTSRTPYRLEGVHEQQWVVIDYGDVVVHVFLNEIRDYYEIERLYRDVPTVEWESGDGHATRGAG